MSVFIPSIHTKALIPAFIFPLNNHQLIWNDVYLFYKYITPAVIEQYLLPEVEKNRSEKDRNNIENKRNILFNQQLLNIINLFKRNL